MTIFIFWVNYTFKLAKLMWKKWEEIIYISFHKSTDSKCKKRPAKSCDIKCDKQNNCFMYTY